MRPILRNWTLVAAVVAATAFAAAAAAAPVGSGTDIVATEGAQFSGVVGTFHESLSADARFVVQGYRDVLGRYPTQQEVDFWLAYLGSGATHEDVARLLLTSAEYRSKVITDVYESLLHRDALPGELAFWLASFTTDDDLRAALVGSAEYYANAGGTDADFVTQAYRDLLGRDPTPAELTAGVLALAAGETRTEFAAGLIVSADRTPLINDLFNRYLRRDPLPAELSFWLGALGSGASDEDLAVSLVGSAEYASKAQSLTSGLGSASAVTIDWGDGSSSSGAVSADPNGGFDVTGTHTYTDEGNDAITIDVVDELSSATTLHSTATVQDAALTLAGASFEAVKKQTFSGTVATGSDSDASAPLPDLSAVISWGDGTESAGTLTATGGGTFTVAGSHVYKKKGVYEVLIALNDVGGASASASAQAAVTNK
jgi:Domain of unknown function (DUF4214)